MNGDIPRNMGSEISAQGDQKESISNIELIDTTLDKIAHNMSFDPNLLIEDPKGGSWDTIKDYISAISYDQEQKHDFFLGRE